MSVREIETVTPALTATQQLMKKILSDLLSQNSDSIKLTIVLLALFRDARITEVLTPHYVNRFVIGQQPGSEVVNDDTGLSRRRAAQMRVNGAVHGIEDQFMKLVHAMVDAGELVIERPHASKRATWMLHRTI